jgi:hypothetical protein
MPHFFQLIDQMRERFDYPIDLGFPSVGNQYDPHAMISETYPAP